MRKLIVTEWMTLDGVVQAPGDSREDGTGGFRHGGWHLRYFDDISREWVISNLTEAGGLVLGRRTYESFAPHWPNAPAEEQVIAEPLNNLPKFVASTTLTEPLEWSNSTLLGQDVPAAITELKRQDHGDLLVIGSSQLVRTLIASDLVDEFRLMVDPLLAGGGKRIFDDDGVLRPLRLIELQPTTTGAVLATYGPARTELRARNMPYSAGERAEMHGYSADMPHR
jgi:dihydrofolate reductase